MELGCLTEMNGGIYIIRNRESHKVYIGSAVNVKKRQGKHYSSLRVGKHFNPHLQRAWNKYGEDVFEFKVLIHCNTNDLLHYEQRVMNVYRRAIGWKMLYNIASKAGSRLGVKCSPEYCRNLSERLKGKPSAMKGKKHTLKTRAKISAASKNRTSEQRAKQSAAQMGNKNNLGNHLGQETRMKISAFQKGRKTSPETKAKISASHSTPEMRARKSAAMKGNKNSLGHKCPEWQKVKLSETMKNNKYGRNKKGK